MTSAVSLSVAFVLPFGEVRDAFFPDTFLGSLCARALRRGHQAELVRVYYDGGSEERDAEVARQLEEWLEERRVDLVVLERLFDPEPLLRHRLGDERRRTVLVSRGDSFEPVEGVDYVIGTLPGTTRSGGTRRTPTFNELAEVFDDFLGAFARREDPAGLPGILSLPSGEGAPLPAEPRDRAWAADLPVLNSAVIAASPPPEIRSRTIFGNSGCPYAADPAERPLFRGLPLEGAKLARLGCAFCSMGGDYQKRPDAAVVDGLIAQARHIVAGAPRTAELVLSDQYAIRYLSSLMDAAAEVGLPPLRWLFAARTDSLLREQDRLRAAIEAAGRAGQVLELYLTGFEAFCDTELERYNKGVTVREQLQAVDAMRTLAAEAPESFAYARARGHSLLLWNPWTRPEDLSATVENVRRHGLMELFDELGRNRLRIYRDLPIAAAAARDGALTDEWDEGDGGSGRRKGYNVELPWRFLDARTARAWGLSRMLRERLGSETEPAQLAAIVAFCRSEDRAPDHVASDLDRLEDVKSERLGPTRGDGMPERAVQLRAAPVLFAGACNNGCESCAQRERWLPDDEAALAARIDAARASDRPVLLAGREPTIHPRFLTLVERARGDDERAVGVVTNARRFSHPRFAQAAARVGLRAASVKLFGPDAASADAISRDPGGFAQALAGIAALKRANVSCELRLPMHQSALETFPRFAPLAVELGLSQLRVELPLDAIGLARLGPAAERLGALADACAREGLALEVCPLAAGARSFSWIPA